MNDSILPVCNSASDYIQLTTVMYTHTCVLHVYKLYTIYIVVV